MFLTLADYTVIEKMLGRFLLSESVTMRGQIFLIYVNPNLYQSRQKQSLGAQLSDEAIYQSTQL